MSIISYNLSRHKCVTLGMEITWLYIAGCWWCAKDVVGRRSPETMTGWGVGHDLSSGGGSGS